MLITEKQLKNIVLESVKKFLKENIINEIFIVYDNEWDKPFNSIKPDCILKDEDINLEDNSIFVNGEWQFYSTEFTNFYADNDKNPKPGDLVFDLGGECVLYRRGLNTPTGCDNSMGGHCIIGTKDELIAFAIEYWEEIMENTGIDTRDIFGK